MWKKFLGSIHKTLGSMLSVRLASSVAFRSDSSMNSCADSSNGGNSDAGDADDEDDDGADTGLAKPPLRRAKLPRAFGAPEDDDAAFGK